MLITLLGVEMVNQVRVGLCRLQDGSDSSGGGVRAGRPVRKVGRGSAEFQIFCCGDEFYVGESCEGIYSVKILDWFHW